MKELAGKLVDRAAALATGNPLLEDTRVGPLILEREVDRVAQWVDEAESAGGKILTGGERMGKTCYAPTVILNPPEEVKLSKMEIFGPVINVYPFRDCKDAVSRANQIPYAFQAAVFTKDLDAAFDIANRLDAAAVMINDHTAFRVDWMPFAGRRESGLGVGGILPTMLEMTEEKLLVFKSPSL